MAVAATGDVEPVEDGTEDPGVDHRQALHAARDVLPHRQPGTNTEQDAVDLGAQDHGVGDRQYGRRVDEDEVVLLLHRGQELAHALGAEQLGGLRRQRPRGDDAEVLDCRG